MDNNFDNSATHVLIPVKVYSALIQFIGNMPYVQAKPILEILNKESKGWHA